MTRYPDAPGHRGVDTSITAANDLAPRLGRLQWLTLWSIREAGETGRTSDEIAIALSIDPRSIQPRTTELCRKGMIRDSGRRRLNVTGKAAIVWVAVTDATAPTADQN